MKGIEPSRPAWEAGVLPLNYTRKNGEVKVAGEKGIVKDHGCRDLSSVVFPPAPWGSVEDGLPTVKTNSIRLSIIKMIAAISNQRDPRVAHFVWYTMAEPYDTGKTYQQRNCSGRGQLAQSEASRRQKSS